MGNGENRKAGRQAKFVFSYREHEVLGRMADPEGDLVEHLARELGEWEWEQQRLPDGDISEHCDPGVRSIGDLAAIARENFVDGAQEPEWLVRIPFDKLAALVDCGGWSFMGGVFNEFEGHHNDTEIEVYLERASVNFADEWRSETVLALARHMDEAREFSAMPILADALQDVGCEDAAILNHCRGPGPHVRGCRVVDLVLGKE